MNEHDWNKVVSWGMVSPEYFIDKPGTVWQRFKTWCAVRHERFTSIMKWLATAVMLAAAGCIALQIQPMHIYLLNLGSFFWLITAILWRERSLIVVNAALLLVYFYGFIRTL
jgi:hypothetical protein